GAVSNGAALLLSETNLVRFRPSQGLVGTATLLALAWDNSAGTAGDRVNLGGAGKTGGSTAFSLTTLTASCAVVNHAPAWSGKGAVLTPVVPGDASPEGDAVSEVFAPYFRDGDGNAIVGIAVVGLTGTVS